MKGPQDGNMFISSWGNQVWFWDDLEAWQAKSIRSFDCGVYFAHIWYSNWRSRPSSRWKWSLSSSDYLKSFGEKNGLKQVERKGLKEGIKVTH